VEYYRDLFLKEQKGMVIITNQPLTVNARQVAEEHRNSLIIIEFESEADLTEKLAEKFKEK
jgi:hypothetical protein